jgi:hypothetical protein
MTTTTTTEQQKQKQTRPVKRVKTEKGPVPIVPKSSSSSSSDALGAIQYGSYADLMKDYATLAICSINRAPPPPPLSSSSSDTAAGTSTSTQSLSKRIKNEQEEEAGEEEDEEEETEGGGGNKKKRKRNNKIVPKALDTRVPFDKTVVGSQLRLLEHVEQCRSNPIQHTIFNLMKSQLVAPTYIDPMCPDEYRSQEEIIDRLKRRQGFYLHVLESSHADIFLYQSGPFRVSEYRVRNFPPCMNGVDCFCNRGKIKCDTNTNAKPFIGRELMFAHEYQIFINTGSKSYQGVRPCVICCRYALCQYVPQYRAKKSLASRGSTTTDTVNWPVVAEPKDTDPPLQLFREKMDVEGGYLSSCMLKPNPGQWEGFIDPISMVILSRMTIRAKQNDGKWVCYVDQDLLKYQPEIKEQPRTGETMSGF